MDKDVFKCYKEKSSQNKQRHKNVSDFSAQSFSADMNNLKNLFYEFHLLSK